MENIFGITFSSKPYFIRFYSIRTHDYINNLDYPIERYFQIFELMIKSRCIIQIYAFLGDGYVFVTTQNGIDTN